MTKSVKIAYPRKGKEIHWTKGTTAKFLAYGQATADVRSVRGRLLDNEGNLVGGVKAQTVRHPTPASPYWAILFTEVPYLDAPGKYRLEVVDKEGVLGRSTELTVRQVEPKREIEITSPEDGECVCPTFWAYGVTDQEGAVTADLVLGATKVNGTQSASPDPTVWVVSFVGVAEGTYDQLEAQIDSTPAVPRKKIKVDPTCCFSVD